MQPLITPTEAPNRALSGHRQIATAKDISKLMLRMRQSSRGMQTVARAVTGPALEARIAEMARRRSPAAAAVADLTAATNVRWRTRRDIAGAIHRSWIRIVGTTGSAAVIDEAVRGENVLLRAIHSVLGGEIPDDLRERLVAFERQVADDVSTLREWRTLIDHGVVPSPSEIPPSPGDAVPRFSAPASTGQTLDSERFRGKLAMALFFVPDLEPRSVRRIASFNRRLRRFGEKRTQVLGIVPAVPARLRRLADDEGFVLPLLADPDGRIRRAFGDPEYATITVGADGRIKRRYVPALGRRHADRVLRDLG